MGHRSPYGQRDERGPRISLGPTRGLRLRDLAPSERKVDILDAAARLFAEHGFRDVSVREIAAAAPCNVAAINYYFGDKLGLYREAIAYLADAMEGAKCDMIPEAPDMSAEDRLRGYVRNFLGRLMAHSGDTWMDRLIARELAEGSPALDIIIERGIRPNAERLARLVAELLDAPPEDQRIWQCSVSVQSQILFYYSSRTVFEHWTPGFQFTPEALDQIAQHIADFSLAGIRAAAARKSEPHKKGQINPPTSLQK